jgi:immune inhibitor A
MTRYLAARLAALAGFAAALLVPAAPSRGAAPSGVLPSPTALAAEIDRAHMPVRDVLALYTRLVRHQASPILPLASPATDYPLGQERGFYIGDETNNTYSLHRARLVYKTPHAYWYFEDGIPVDTAGLAQAAQTFERHIYPTDTAAFGPDRDPAIDRDPRLVIYSGTTPGVGGYVSSEDLLPRAVFPYSNQGKVIYVAFASGNPNTQTYLMTVAHEFQHMIHKYLHPEDEIWINEGASMLAQELNGYGVQGDDQAMAASGPLQLDAWSATVGSAAMYGAAYLWLLYFYEHYGGNRFTRLLLADSDRSHLPLFDDILARLGYRTDSTAVFGDWVVANFLNDPRLAGGRYGYRESAIHAAVTMQHPLPATLGRTMPQYAASYLDITATHGKPFTLHFAGQPTVGLLDTTPPVPVFWWSNRGDNVDTTLTSPPIDLSGVRHATLRYQVRYDLETDYDYGYVEASTDGGRTWHSLPTAHTTDANPEGANLGNGYTGNSCSAAGRDKNCWVSEHADLSPFAGKRILLRWEQVTDEGYNAQGLALAHITIPEAGVSLDTTTPGWQPAGWLVATNTLAEQWLVTALVFGPHGVRVMPISVGGDGRGSLAVPAGSTHVVVCVSPIAPETTVAASFILRAG